MCPNQPAHIKSDPLEEGGRKSETLAISFRLQPEPSGVPEKSQWVRADRLPEQPPHQQPGATALAPEAGGHGAGHRSHGNGYLASAARSVHLLV